MSRAVSRLARETGLTVVDLADRDEEGLVVVAAVLNGSEAQSASELPGLRENFPSALFVAYLAEPSQITWMRLERAGFDLVCTRGGLAPALRKLLARVATTGAREIVACDSSNIAGRIGHLMELDLPIVGEVSLWRIAGQIVCTGKCPHQGQSLAQGEIEEGVVTCPAHGSRFDLLTGERVRGPSDFDLPCFRAYEKNGRVWVVPKG